MRLLKLIAVFVTLSIITSLNSNAQIRGLLKRAKDRASEKVEELAEKEVQNQVDRQVDKLVENLWEGSKDGIGKMLENAMPKAKTSVDTEKGIIHREGLDDLKIVDNEKGPTDASFVSYLTVSLINLPDNVSEFAARFGNATVEEVRYSGDRKLSGGLEQGVLVEHDLGQFTYLDHVAGQYWSNTYEEMFGMAGEAMDKMREGMKDMAPPEATVEQAPSVDADVSFMSGGRKTVRGLDARQSIVVVETTMEDNEEGESAGKMWVVTELWTARKYGGSESLDEFDRRVGEDMVEAMGGATLDASLDFSLFGDPRLMEGLNEASTKLDEVGGFPVETNTYFVMTDEETELDVDAVLEGGPSQEGDSQITMMSTSTFITNLSTQEFDLALLNPHAAYEQVESPLMKILESSGGD